MLHYVLKLLFIIDNFHMAKEIFNHNFAIDCPGMDQLKNMKWVPPSCSDG